MVQASALRYQVVEGWEKLPAGKAHRDVAGVATDSQDRVFLICRGDDPIMVYDRDGNFLRSWGQEFFTQRTHGISIGPDDSIYATDDGHHTVRKFSPSGELLITMGTPNEPSNTGYEMGKLDTICCGGPPFNRPTNVAIAANGDLYVSDGYGNSRVHHFSPKGELVRSWGEPGDGPGQFRLPHGIGIDRHGRILVCDREIDRIQIFSPEGEYLTEWTNVQRPTQIFIDRNDLVYISELWWHKGQKSYSKGLIEAALPARVSVYDLEGTLLHRWGEADMCAPGNFAAPHSLCVDSRGDIYVGEVTWTFAVSRGLAPDGCHTLQKFARVDG